MIMVSKINGAPLIVNAEIIDFIETMPDTVLTLASGKKIVVRETPEEIIDKIIAYRQRIYLNLPTSMAKHLYRVQQEALRKGEAEKLDDEAALLHAEWEKSETEGEPLEVLDIELKNATGGGTT